MNRKLVRIYSKKTFKIVSVIFAVCFVLYIALLIFFGGLGKKHRANYSTERKDSVKLFTHRGVSIYFPENSIEAVKQSAIRGINAELDITRSQDKELIIFHDENCMRLLGINKEIDHLKTAELKKYPIIFNNKKSNSYVTTVNELLGSDQKNMTYYFDMKLTSFGDADDVAALIKKHRCTKSVIVANSDVLFTLYMELRHPEIITALEGFDAGKEWTYGLIPRELKPDFLSGYLRNTDDNHIRWLKRNDLMPNRIIYGVDTSNIDFALLSGFKNIILDYDSTLITRTLARNYLFKTTLAQQVLKQ